MHYARLGATNLKISRITLGAMGFGSKTWRRWVLELDESRAVFRAALEAGINLVDTCNYYSAGASEEIVGTLLGEFGVRHQFVLATKFGHTMGKGPNERGYSRKHIIEALDASLRRLKTDYIDIYQTHIWDRAANRDEMMAALDAVVTAGKVRYIGITDMPFWQFASSQLQAKYGGLTPFASVQNHYNLLWREDERDLMPFCAAEGIGMIPYSPLARGFLLGGAARAAAKRTERAGGDEVTARLYGRPADDAVIAALAAVAGRLGASPTQVALAWVLSRLGVTAALFGPTSPAHVTDAVGALTLQLSDADRRELEAGYLPRPARDGA